MGGKKQDSFVATTIKPNDQLCPRKFHKPVIDPNLSVCLAGEHLRLCPQDYTCCSSQMEETLALQSERDFLKAVEENSQFLLTTFTQRHRRFDGEAQKRLFNEEIIRFDKKYIYLGATVGTF